MQAQEISVYVHIPYCKSRCDYCDFVTTTNAKLSTEQYVPLLIRELDARREILDHKRIVSLYIGGGTPSLVTAHDLAILCEALGAHDIEEVTVELNPGDIHQQWFQALVEAGVNRFSIGGQAFTGARLHALGRRHGVEQIEEAVDMARRSGATNVGVDFIYGTEGQSIASVEQELELMLRLHPDHVSAYELTVAQGTGLGRRVAAGEISLPGEEQLVAMWEAVGRRLAQNGLSRYEISNYARPGFSSVQNEGYWIGRPYLALGVGAHGLLYDRQGRRVRYANTRNLLDYAGSTAEGAPYGAVGASGLTEVVSDSEHAAELVFLGMRMARGVSCATLRQLLPELDFRQWMSRFAQFEHSGKVLMGPESVVPTEQGMLLADYIAQNVVAH